jgi:LPXTG-motif cell wall-anchored protein
MSKRRVAKLATTIGLVSMAVLAPIGFAAPATAAPGGLCASNSEYADEDWITSLILGSGTSVGVAQGEIYKNASATSVGTYAAGNSYNISLTINVDITEQGGDDWDEHVFVWLDLNQNGTVDLDNEEIFSDSAMTSSMSVAGSDPNLLTKTFTGTFTVPANAYNGTVYGRAMLQYVEPNSDPIMCNSDPDGWDPGVSAFEAGTVLDFKVNLTGGIDNPNLANTGAETDTLGLVGLTAIGTGSVLAVIARRKRKVL